MSAPQPPMPHVGYPPQQGQQQGGYGGMPPPPPAAAPQQQQQQQQQQANPDVFVRRLYKPRLQDQPVLGAAGVVAQLASLSKRSAAVAAAASAVDLLSGGDSGMDGGRKAPPDVLASEVAQTDFLLSPALALPEEFGKIYLGETFSAYVSIVNTLPHPILLVEAQASLKSSRSSEILLNNMAPLRAGHTSAPLVGLGIGRDRPRQLQPGENLDVVVEHVLQELDWHYLAIKLDFLETRAGTPEGAPRPMMKRFKFKVYNPVAITTTHRLVSGGGGGGGGGGAVGAGCSSHHAEEEVLIQAQVKNITERHTSLMLEDVAFVPEDGLVAKPLPNLAPVDGDRGDGNPCGSGPAAVALSPSRIRRLALVDGGGAEDDDEEEAEEEDSCDCVQAFDRHVYLQPDDVVQFIYRLRRAGSYKGRAMVLAPGMPLGQLRVSWRTTLGEAGTLLSPRVICSTEAASTPRALELRLEAPLTPSLSSGNKQVQPQQRSPSQAAAAASLVQGQVYTAQCALVNNTERDLWLQVQFHLEAMQGVYVTGKAFQNAGLVPAHSKRPLAFQLLPLMAGLHEVKGVTIVDLVTAHEYHQDRLCEVMVVRQEEGGDEGHPNGKAVPEGASSSSSGLEHVLGSN